MKAIHVTEHGGPEVLKLADLPNPAPGRDQVLVRVRAAGVNPVDTYIRSGVYPNSKVPYVPGLDAAGTIDSVGEGVSDWKAGDRVYTSGTVSGAYAEFALCNRNTVHPLPENISFSQGASLGVPYSTACRALFQKARAQAGETVLIHGGSGGVGTAAIQFARAAGLKVFATSSTEKGRELVKSLGADHALDHASGSYREELMRLTDERGVDIILEMLANVNLGSDLKMLAKFGRVVIIGSRGNVEITPRDAMAREASILGMTLFNASGEDLASIHEQIFTGLQNGTLAPVIGEELPLSDAARAHTAIMESGSHGKIILKP